MKLIDEEIQREEKQMKLIGDGIQREDEHMKLIDEGNNQLGDDGVGLLCDAISEQTEEEGIKVLILTNTGLTCEVGTGFNKVLNSSCILETLVLSLNDIGTEGIVRMKEGALRSRTLRHLELRGANIDCEGVAHLAQIIYFNPDLERLDLRDNPIKYPGLAALRDCLVLGAGPIEIELDDREKELQPLVEEIRKKSLGIGEDSFHCPPEERGEDFEEKVKLLLEKTLKRQRDGDAYGMQHLGELVDQLKKELQEKKSGSQSEEDKASGEQEEGKDDSSKKDKDEGSGDKCKPDKKPDKKDDDEGGDGKGPAQGMTGGSSGTQDKSDKSDKDKKDDNDGSDGPATKGPVKERSGKDDGGFGGTQDKCKPDNKSDNDKKDDDDGPGGPKGQGPVQMTGLLSTTQGQKEETSNKGKEDKVDSDSQQGEKQPTTGGQTRQGTPIIKANINPEPEAEVHHPLSVRKEAERPDPAVKNPEGQNPQGILEEDVPPPVPDRSKKPIFKRIYENETTIAQGRNRMRNSSPLAEWNENMIEVGVFMEKPKEMMKGNKGAKKKESYFCEVMLPVKDKVAQGKHDSKATKTQKESEKKYDLQSKVVGGAGWTPKLIEPDFSVNSVSRAIERAKEREKAKKESYFCEVMLPVRDIGFQDNSDGKTQAEKNADIQSKIFGGARRKEWTEASKKEEKKKKKKEKKEKKDRKEKVRKMSPIKEIPTNIQMINEFRDQEDEELSDDDYLVPQDQVVDNYRFITTFDDQPPAVPERPKKRLRSPEPSPRCSPLPFEAKERLKKSRGACAARDAMDEAMSQGMHPSNAKILGEGMRRQTERVMKEEEEGEELYLMATGMETEEKEESDNEDLLGAVGGAPKLPPRMPKIPPPPALPNRPKKPPKKDDDDEPPPIPYPSKYAAIGVRIPSCTRYNIHSWESVLRCAPPLVHGKRRNRYVRSHDPVERHKLSLMTEDERILYERNYHSSDEMYRMIMSEPVNSVYGQLLIPVTPIPNLSDDPNAEQNRSRIFLHRSLNGEIHRVAPRRPANIIALNYESEEEELPSPELHMNIARMRHNFITTGSPFLRDCKRDAGTVTDPPSSATGAIKSAFNKFKDNFNIFRRAEEKDFWELDYDQRNELMERERIKKLSETAAAEQPRAAHGERHAETDSSRDRRKEPSGKGCVWSTKSSRMKGKSKRKLQKDVETYMNGRYQPTWYHPDRVDWSYYSPRKQGYVFETPEAQAAHERNIRKWKPHSVRAYANRGESSRLYANQGESSRLYANEGESSRLYANQGESSRLYANQGESSGLYTNQGESSGLYINEGESSGLYTDQGDSSGLYINEGESSGLYPNLGESSQLYTNQEDSSRLYDNERDSSRLYTNLGDGCWAYAPQAESSWGYIPETIDSQISQRATSNSDKDKHIEYEPDEKGNKIPFELDASKWLEYEPDEKGKKVLMKPKPEKWLEYEIDEKGRKVGITDGKEINWYDWETDHNQPSTSRGTGGRNNLGSRLQATISQMSSSAARNI